MSDDQLLRSFSKLFGGFTSSVPAEQCKAAMQSVDLNRYSNILPFDSHLASEPDQYCNASLIQVPECEQTYVIAQGPMNPAFYGPDTVPAFWQVMRNQGVRVVVSLTAFSPGFSGCADPVACDPTVRVIKQFTPASLDTAATDTAATDTAEKDTAGEGSPKGLLAKLGSTLRRKKRNEHDDEETVISLLDLGEGYLLHYVHFRAWPNYGTCSPMQLASLIQTVDRLQTAYQPSEETPMPLPPIGVHCSGGIGRSGTFAAVDATFRRLQPKLSDSASGANFNPFQVAPLPLKLTLATLNDTIDALRHARHPWMVEGENQYKLSFNALQFLRVNSLKHKD